MPQINEQRSTPNIIFDHAAEVRHHAENKRSFFSGKKALRSNIYTLSKFSGRLCILIRRNKEIKISFGQNLDDAGKSPRFVQIQFVYFLNSKLLKLSTVRFNIITEINQIFIYRFHSAKFMNLRSRSSH